jgi:MFS family permease
MIGLRNLAALGVQRIGRGLVPLSEPAFRLYWVGQTVSAVGGSLMPVALAFATLQVAGSASALGIVLGTGITTRLLLLPLGGVWGDRLPRQVVMLTADGAQAAVQAVLAVLLITGTARLWELVVAAAVQGVATAFFQPTSSGLIRQTVSSARLQQANALMGLSRSGSQIGGPALAGVLVAVLNPGWAFAANAVSFVASTVTLAGVPSVEDDRRQKESLWRELLTGWQEIARRPWYFVNLCTHAIWNFAIVAFFVLGPVVARSRLGGPSAWGLISSSVAIGSVAGGLVALALLPRRPLVAGNLALTLSALQLLALAGGLPVIVIIATTALGFAGVTFLNEVWSATMQQLMPKEALARVSSYEWLLSLAAMPLGYAMVGPVADRIGVPATLVAASLVLTLPSVLIILVPGVRAVRRTPEGVIVGPEPA